MTNETESRDGPLLFYISGYGRSGSTILARLLAENQSVLNLGEIALAPWFLRMPNKRCPCGAELGVCPVWALVSHDWLAKLGKVADVKTHRAIIEAIAASHPNTQAIVDSSKSCWGLALRAFQLRSLAIGDVRVVHLIRDPRGVLWSQLRDGARKGKPLSTSAMLGRGLRTALGWLVANIAAESYGLVYPKSYTRLTYEQLMLSGLPPALRAYGGAGSPQGRIVDAASGHNHDLVGNRLRHRSGRPIELDNAWLAALPKPASVLIVMLCWPLMLRYGHLSLRMSAN